MQQVVVATRLGGIVGFDGRQDMHPQHPKSQVKFLSKTTTSTLDFCWYVSYIYDPLLHWTNTYISSISDAIHQTKNDNRRCPVGLAPPPRIEIAFHCTLLADCVVCLLFSSFHQHSSSNYCTRLLVPKTTSTLLDPQRPSYLRSNVSLSVVLVEQH
jgi:hypothetical protein